MKKVTLVDLEGVAPAPAGQKLPVVAKQALIDTLPALQALKGWTIEKIEGLAMLPDGRLVMVSDNDDVGDAPSESRLLDLGPLPTTN